MHRSEERAPWREVAVVAALTVALSVLGATPASAAVAKRKTTKAKPVLRVGVLAGDKGSRSESRQVAEAWATAANSAGGVNGFRVQVVYRDADGDPGKAVEAIESLDDAGVLAVDLADASVIPAVADLLVDQELPAVGGQPYASEWDWHPMLFPVEAGPTAALYGQVSTARHVGARHFRNLYCAETCGATVTTTEYAAQREGLRHSAQAVPGQGGDQGPVCAAAKSDAVDFLQLNGLRLTDVVKACSRAGYHPTYGMGWAAPGTLDQVKGEKVAGALAEFGVFYDGPEVARFRQAVARAGLSPSAGTATQASVQTWLAMEMFGAIVRRIAVAEPTRRDFLNAAYTVKGETLGGQIAPMDYTIQRPGTGGHAASDCWTEDLVADGRFVHMGSTGQVASRLTWICGTGAHYRTAQPPI